VGERRFGIQRDDPYAFYLSYQLGQRGYARGAHRRNHAARTAAARVVQRTRRYALQLSDCHARLDEIADDAWWWPF
jgi:hypothetical protein